MSHSADAESVINNVLRMTQSVLEAAAEVKSVKRVILTSSATAVPLAKPGVEGVIIDENSWNDKAVQLAWNGSDSSDPSNFVTVYSASKTEGERFAFTWVKEHNPHFVFNSILPNFVVRNDLSSYFILYPF
jgi:nucleoside-diphosphate-sugar epimerase